MARKHWLARHLMKTELVSVSPEIHLRELAQLLDDKGISGAPVIDRDGTLVGVVTKSDLVRHQHTGEPADRLAYYRHPHVEVLPRGYHEEIPDRTQVREIMTPAIISAREDAPAAALARLMRRRRIHRVFITRDKKLCGVVTTMDLLRVVETT